MPFAKQHSRLKKKIAKQKSSSSRFCQCAICKGRKIQSVKVLERHLKVFGSYDRNSPSSSSDDEIAVAGPSHDKVAGSSIDDSEYPLSSRSKNPLSCSDSSRSVDCVSDNETELEISQQPKYSTSEESLAEQSDEVDESVEISNLNYEYEYDDSSSTASSLTSDASSLSEEDDDYSSEIAKLNLYDGCPVTVLEALAGYFSWFTEFPAVSKNALSSILILNKNLLPSPNNLPGSYEEAMRFVKPFLLPLQCYHVCVNDCVIYRKSDRYDYSKLDACPICGANRYSNKKQPRRKFEYYPLGPRWKRMYGTTTISEVLQSHMKPRDNIMRDIHDSPSWLKAFSESGDARAIQLQLSTDGVNPFSSNKVSYSMWPIMLSNLNLPRSVRSYFGNIMLVGVIPAQDGGGEPRKLDPYLEIVVDELLSLTGKTFYDAYKRESFEFKCSLLNFVLDYPGCAKIFNAAGPTALQACMWCDLRGCHIKALDKVVFLENRRFLPANHELRLRNPKHFPSGKVETKGPPEKTTNDDLLRSAVAYNNAKNKSQAANIMKATGSKGVNCFMLLPNNDRTRQNFPDVMHNIKNVTTAFFDLFTGRGYSSKVKDSEVALGRFKESFDSEQGPPFLLTKSQLKMADERANRVIVPTGYGWNPCPFFRKRSYLKSHDWQQLAVDGILKFCLRDCLGGSQRTTFFHLLDVLSCICDEVQDERTLEDLKIEVDLVCAEIERDFPISIQTISLHILHHIVAGIKMYGPVHSWWMYVYERFNSWICQRVKNRRHPEVNVMETYRLFNWVQFMKMSQCIELPIFTEDEPCKTRKNEEAYHPTEEEKDHVRNQPGVNCDLDNQETTCTRTHTYRAKCNDTRSLTWREHYYVCIFREPNFEIGIIEHFFTFKYFEVEHVFVTLSTFPHSKTQDGLFNINFKSGSQKKTVRFDLISKPLVVGHDDQEDDIIWLLNVGTVIRQRVVKT